MPNDLEKKIRRLVSEGQKVRTEYFESIDLDDEQELGPPAGEAQIKQLEAKFGANLPPSYRTFLKLFGRWRMVDGAMDLISVPEMLEGPTAERLRQWRQQTLKAGDEDAANSLVIGYSQVTPTRLLLDPNQVEEEEWAVVQYHHGEEGVYPSFLAWLEESIDEFKELLSEENEDDEDLDEDDENEAD